MKSRFTSLISILIAGAALLISARGVYANKPVVRGHIYVFGTNAPLNDIQVTWTDRRDTSGCSTSSITFEQATGIKVFTGKGYSWKLSNRSGTVTVAAGEYAFDGDATSGGKMGCNCGPHDFRAVPPPEGGYFTNAAGQVTNDIAIGINFNDPKWGGGNVGEQTPDMPPLYYHAPGPTTVPPTAVPPTATLTPTPIPQPTNTPTPSPSPTPVQETQTVDQPANSTLSQRADASTAQRWVCLDAKPCTQSSSECSSRGEAAHRVKLVAKPDVKPDPIVATYVFECLQTSSGTKCTSGNSDTDTTIVGNDNLTALRSAYNYRFTEFVDMSGKTVANPIPAGTSFGTYEWESHNNTNIGRLFLAVNTLSPGTADGALGAEHQSTLLFDSPNKTCLQIKWDPYGTVYDSKNGQVIAKAQVALYRQMTNGKFELDNGTNVLGGLPNPVLTDSAGFYSFYVPDGVYRLRVSAVGYVSQDIPVTRPNQRLDIKMVPKR